MQPWHFASASLICTQSLDLDSDRTVQHLRERESMQNFNLGAFVLIMLMLLVSNFLQAEAQTCKPSGHVKVKNTPPGQCNQGNDSSCCVEGKPYPTYRCSPPVSRHTKAVLTLNSFENGGGDMPPYCDSKYHSDVELIVALSTGWYNGGERCLHNITISANGRSVKAKVVDECDSTMGCDEDHDYQPPCANNIVNASKAVWKALGVPEHDWSELDITWSDA